MTTATTPIKEFLNKEAHKHIIESGKLPALPQYNPKDGIMIPHSFSNIEEVKAFIQVINLRGHCYRVRNTSKNKRISYECPRCKNLLSFSHNGKIVKPTKGNNTICDCSREGRHGNKLQKFPPEMVKIAISALFESGILDIADTKPDVIIDTLREEYDFTTADEILVGRIREEFNKISPLKDPSFNEHADAFSRRIGSFRSWYENGDDGHFARCFMSLRRCEGQRVCVMKYYSDERNMTHYVGFVEGEDIPFAWGSANEDCDLDSDGWFRKCLGQESLLNVDSNYSVDVAEILDWEYNAFGTAYGLYAMCTHDFVTLSELLGAQTIQQQSNNVISPTQQQYNFMYETQFATLSPEDQQQQFSPICYSQPGFSPVQSQLSPSPFNSMGLTNFGFSPIQTQYQFQQPQQYQPGTFYYLPEINENYSIGPMEGESPYDLSQVGLWYCF